MDKKAVRGAWRTMYTHMFTRASQLGFGTTYYQQTILASI